MGPNNSSPAAGLGMLPTMPLFPAASGVLCVVKPKLTDLRLGVLFSLLLCQSESETRSAVRIASLQDLEAVRDRMAGGGGGGGLVLCGAPPALTPPVKVSQ